MSVLKLKKLTASWLPRLMLISDLGRIRMALPTITVPIVGGLAAQEALAMRVWIGLAIVGLCAHVFGFGLNDIIDHKLDSTLSYARNPIATGHLRLRQAWLIIFLSVIIALGIYGLYLSGTIQGFVVLITSVLCSVIYNLWSKWGKLPRFVAEMALAVSVGLLCLAGAMLSSPMTPIAAKLSAVTIGFILLLLNSVPSGLKDVRNDRRFGAHSFVLASGADVDNEDRLTISSFLRIYSMTLQAVILFCILGLILVFRSPLFTGMLALVLTVYGGLHLRLILASKTFGSLRRSNPLLSGVYNYAALLVLLLSHVPWYLHIPFWIYLILLISKPWHASYWMWRKRYRLSG
jgi:4-hydroxybenzoate polyprenyltransferase